MPEGPEPELPAWVGDDVSPSETLGLGTDDRPEVDLEAELAGGERLILGRVLGQGGHSVVHAAQQVVLGREVAVKSVRAEHPDADGRVLVHEARITGILEHPNIVPIHDIDLGGRHPRIVLKRITGASWHDRLRQDPGDVAEHVRILLSVCNAVAYAHDRGILHRDIKPQNVMLGTFGEVYLVDWGIACSLRERDRGRIPLASEQRDPVGTPAYMCPEMVSSSWGPLSPATDVYLLGACLRKVLTGKAPWSGRTRVVVELLRAGSEPEPTDTGPPMLRRLCDQALRADPAARPSLGAMQEELQRWLAQRGLDTMVARAHQQLRALEEGIAEGAQEGDIQSRFVSCRAVFEAVLEAAADREDARDGLERAVRIMATHALDHGDHAAARFLLGQLSEAPEALIARVEALEAEARAAQGELAALRQEHDVVAGTPVRLLAMGISGASAFLAPIAVTLAMEPTYQRGMVSVALTFVGSSFAIALAWPILRTTRANRSLALLVLASIFYTLPVFAGSWLLGFDAERGVVAALLVYAALFGLYAAIEERWLLPSAAVWLGAFLLASAVPSSFIGALSGSVAVTLGNAVAVWGVRWSRA